MKIAVIEWDADDALAPDVCLGTEKEVLWHSAVAMYERMRQEPERYADALDEAGDPHEMYLPQLWRWHQVVHEDHTIPWVTFYEHDGEEACARPDDGLNRRLMGVAS